MASFLLKVTPNMIKRTLFLLSLNIVLLTILPKSGIAQSKYWVALYDNTASNTEQLQALTNTNHEVKIHYYSTFLDAYSVTIQQNTLDHLMKAEIIKSYTKIRKLDRLGSSFSESEYDYALAQINAWYITDSLAVSGKGIKVGIIDGGFMEADINPYLSNAFRNDQLIYFSDYLQKENENPFYGKRKDKDDHGTKVLKMIIGNDVDEQLQSGLATDALLYLARTDHGIDENRLEEDYWVMALESFYQQGVRLVNSSLGYIDSFDKKKENHKKDEVDGESTMITKAAQKAAEKGMLIIVSAGNSGSSKWKTLSLPADAKDIIAVGASNFGDWSKMWYSSIGPEKLSYIKPDVACYAANGTSYAAPIITGLAACIWEYDSSLSNYELINIIEKSGHLAEIPNNYLGHGVPDAGKIMKLLHGKALNPRLLEIKAEENILNLGDYSRTKQIAYFHKINATHVLEHGIRRRNNLEESLIIKRKNKKITRTTITSKSDLLIEIIWPD